METSMWYYEYNGKRTGPISENEIDKLIKSDYINGRTLVWKQGYDEWISLKDSELKAYLNPDSPPPLSSDKINNTAIWFLAFAPFIGMVARFILLEIYYPGVLSGKFYSNVNEYTFWYTTIIFNILFAVWDDIKLRSAGYKLFPWYIFLIPVYLWQRATILGQSRAYFWVWIVVFILTLL
jgi:hypothetical protein